MASDYQKFFGRPEYQSPGDWFDRVGPIRVPRSESLSRPSQRERSMSDIKSAQEDIVPGLWSPNVLRVFRTEFLVCEQRPRDQLVPSSACSFAKCSESLSTKYRVLLHSVSELLRTGFTVRAQNCLELSSRHFGRSRNY